MLRTPFLSLPQSPVCKTALAGLSAGISVLPIRDDGSKQPALSAWKPYQQERPCPEEVEAWFAHSHQGLALITGSISGGLIALDFDDPGIFDAWRERVRSDRVLGTLYNLIGQGYEERTPKGGRHLLFRCPEAFQQDRKPGNQKLALRPVAPPKRFETLVETREEGGLIIIYPSHGSVHPSGKPYYLLRGSVSEIKTITATQREQLYNSVRAFDETPKVERKQPNKRSGISSTFQPAPILLGRSAIGKRPGDLFNNDPAVTWEHLLAGWELIERKTNGNGQQEGYWRHPGKVGPNHSATTNADGTNRLFVFSPSIGLPMNHYLSKFEYYTYWKYHGDFTQAARALVEQGYAKRT